MIVRRSPSANVRHLQIAHLHSSFIVEFFVPCDSPSCLNQASLDSNPVAVTRAGLSESNRSTKQPRSSTSPMCIERPDADSSKRLVLQKSSRINSKKPIREGATAVVPCRSTQSPIRSPPASLEPVLIPQAIFFSSSKLMKRSATFPLSIDEQDHRRRSRSW